jgi:hypothetical protein
MFTTHRKPSLCAESAVGFVEIGIKSSLRLSDVLHAFQDRVGDSGGKRIVCFAVFRDQVSELWTSSIRRDGGFLGNQGVEEGSVGLDALSVGGYVSVARLACSKHIVRSSSV